MQEFWFCSNCKSMNRAGSTRCYKCHAAKEQATLATVAERSTGVVLTPGLDEDHREVAWTLMSGNRYVSAWRLGYVVAGLMTVWLAAWTFDSVLFAIYLVTGLVSPERQAALLEFVSNPPYSLILGVISLSVPVTIVLHSGFLALTSMDSPGLGSGSPRFGPVRAGLWWIESYLWIVWGVLLLTFPIYAVGLVIIPYRLMSFGGLFLGPALVVTWGLFVRYVYLELGGPLAAIGKPRRLLQDLMDRLGVPGASDSRLVGQWSVAWGTLVGTTYAIIWGPILLIVAVVTVWLGAGVAGITLAPSSERQIELYLTILVLLVGAFVFFAYGALMYLTLRITIELSRRQRRREAWVLGGLADATAVVVAPGGPRMAQAVPQPQPQPPAQMAPEPPLSFYGSTYRTAPQPGPAADVGLAPGSQVGVPPVVRAPEEPVVWSRQVERMVSRPDFGPLPPEELPPDWQRVIQRSGAPVPKPPAPEATSPDPQTPPVESPPVEPPPKPIENRSDDLDIGSGI